MKILKFGGTSVGAPERMHSVANLINDGEEKIVVLSAVSGTTNALVEIGNYFFEGKSAEALACIDKLHDLYKVFVPKLYPTEEGVKIGTKIINSHFEMMKSYATKSFKEAEQRLFLAEGELISTELFTSYLIDSKINAVLLPALDFMSIDADNEPKLLSIEEQLTKILANHTDCKLFITQGYICRNHKGEVDNLKRGGSDYTGTLIGAALRANEIQIWTDIDGMHNNDPRIVKNTFPIAEISFDEAAELAYFGAKILHPTCIRPAHERNVPVRLLNTMEPSQKGTVITNKLSEREITAIAAKDNITSIKIKSSRMLLAYGFLTKVFEVFERFKTSIDVITTSEVAVAVTIDETTNLEQIVAELEKFATIEVEHKFSIICIVGNFGQEKSGVGERIFGAMRNIPIHAVSYGGSDFNITMLVKTVHKNDSLNALNENLFSLI